MFKIANVVESIGRVILSQVRLFNVVKVEKVVVVMEKDVVRVVKVVASRVVGKFIL